MTKERPNRGVRSRKVMTKKHIDKLNKYNPKPGKKRVFRESCIFKYDEIRTGTKKNPNEVTLHGRCTLIKSKSKKCSFPDETHITCLLSTHKKPMNRNNKNKKRFAGRKRKQKEDYK